MTMRKPCWRRKSRSYRRRQVLVYGIQKFAVRVQVDPVAAAARNISLDDIRSVVAKANSSAPVGTLQGKDQSVTLLATGAMTKAADYRDVVGRLSQRGADQAQRGGAGYRQCRKRQDRDLVQRFTCHRARDPNASRMPIPSRSSILCAASCRRCAHRCRPRSRCSRCSTARSRSASGLERAGNAGDRDFAGDHGHLSVPA